MFHNKGGQTGFQAETVNTNGITSFNFGGSELPESLETKRKKLLRTLYKSSKTEYENQKNQNPVRVSGTCEWFTNHQTFQDWKSSPSSKMLWVSADPGSGKSVLARYLIDSVLPTPGSTICYFFFKEDLEEQRKSTTALCSILFQLFTANRSLICDEILDRFEIVGESFSSLFSELWSAFLIVANNAGEIVCVLDALDECNSSDRSQLITKLKELYGKATDLNLKFLVTSRPTRDIVHALRLVREVLHEVTGQQPLEVPESLLIHLNGDGDEEKEKIAREINTFIDARVHEISTKLRLGDNERNLLSERLKNTQKPHSNNAGEMTQNRTYLWVYLVLDLIEKDPNTNIGINKDTIDKVTSQLPKTIDEAYEKILSRSCKHEEAKRLLQIVVAASRPLNLKEIYVAFILKESHRSYDSIKPKLNFKEMERFGYDIRDLCGLFIRVVDSKIYLIHQTAKEFLVQYEEEEGGEEEEEKLNIHSLRRNTGWKGSLRMRHCHKLLADICMQHLSKFSELEIDAFTERTELSDYTKKYPFIDYSAKNWVTHLKRSQLQARFGKLTAQSIVSLCDSTTKRCQTWFRIYWTSTNTDFSEGFTTLMILSYFGIAPVVEVFLKWNYDIDLDERDDRYKRSALSWAAGNGFDAVVTGLLRGAPWKGRIYLPFRYRGTDIDSVDGQGRTPLVHAILNKQELVANLLIRAGAQTDLKDRIGGTPLHYAICSGQNNLVAQMLKKGSKVGLEHDTRKELFFSAAKDSNGNTALWLAVGNGNKKLVQLLLHRGARPSVEVQNSDSSVPLGLATERGYKEIAELLLDTGANVDIRHRGSTPLKIAADKNLTKMIQLLLDKGANPNASGDDDQTPLMIAAEILNWEMVKLLVDKGANSDVKGYYDRTPLMIAAERLNWETVKLLVDKGANPDVKGYNGRTPLMIAAEESNWEMVKLLLDRGANPNIKGYYDRTPLMIAAEESNWEMVILDRGANPNIKGYYDRTPLMIAVYTLNWEMVKVLLDKGADVEAKNLDGETALFRAVRQGDEEIIRLLVKHGADITAANIWGKTPLTKTLESKNRRVLQLLVEGDDRYSNLLSELPEEE
ncbi:hypothetical protein TWF679_009550 [Orbilia oligospora]|uniref:NACHT domain-containing protein n=1 Tax=Orbilia oligospora TaxID=2813651 RepID=A0A8H8V2F1_ORBOL|nr:hypothetical protein TWF679_009550 [Orbilia oligospora]